MKKLLLVVVAMVILLVGVVGTARASGIDPLVQRLINQVSALWAKVNTIQQPIVRDAMGVKVGVLLGGRGTAVDGLQGDYNVIEVFDTNFNAVARYDMPSATASSDHNFAVKFLTYASDDCTGQAYATNVNADPFTGPLVMLANPHVLVERLISSGPNEHYVGSGAVAQNARMESRIRPDQSCDSDFSGTFDYATPVTQVRIPYQGPLTTSLE